MLIQNAEDARGNHPLPSLPVESGGAGRQKCAMGQPSLRIFRVLEHPPAGRLQELLQSQAKTTVVPSIAQTRFEDNTELYVFIHTIIFHMHGGQHFATFHSQLPFFENGSQVWIPVSSVCVLTVCFCYNEFCSMEGHRWKSVYRGAPKIADVIAMKKGTLR